MAAAGSAAGGDGESGGDVHLLRDYSTLGSEANLPVCLRSFFGIQPVHVLPL